MKLALFLTMAIILIACSGGSSSGLTVPDDPDRLLLSVTSEGGFVPVEFNLDRMPWYVLMADGTLYYQGPTTLEFPGRLLPNVQQTRISSEDIDRVLALIEEIGLPEMSEEVDQTGTEMVADATTEFFTYHDDEGAHRFGVYALGLIERPSTAHLLAVELMEVLDEVAMSGESIEYQPERLQVAAGPPVPMDVPGDIQAWPLSVSFAEMNDWGMDWRCVEVSGDDIGAVLPSFQGANQATRWEEGSETYTIKVRPLLPGETACAGAPGV